MSSGFFRVLRSKPGMGLFPKSLLGRLVIILAGFVSAISLVRPLVKTPSAQVPLELSSTFLSMLLVIVAGILALRWIRTRLMWRLRNRLIITYVFIGVIPLILLLAMGTILGYLFAGQFSTFVVTADLASELRRVEASNNAIAAQVALQTAENPRRTPVLKILKDEQLDREFPGRSVTAWVGDRATVLQKENADTGPLLAPDYTKQKDSFGSLALDEHNHMHLRAVSTRDTGRERLTVVSSVPITPGLLSRMVQGLGIVTLQRPDNQNEQKNANAGVQANFNSGGNSILGLQNRPDASVSAGELRSKQGRLDVELTFGTALTTYEWATGKPSIGVLAVQTRPSLLYDRLFRTLGEFANSVLSVLFGIAIFFALIELLALFVGIRLTRTMTKSVAALYDATQHVNQGDFTHRIDVTSKDQLAALETSFNSMTGSLQELIAEQKEKQRIESELAIAQEVQALLFPRDITELDTLEVHGVCKPARTVSGDYYDFLPVGPNRLGLAVGDISGKGISAALLMATVHAFVRAYTLVEGVPSLAEPAIAGGAAKARDAATIFTETADLPPGTLLAMLNQQLYRSTPTEKYATMFLGFYDARSRELTYSNAGHLPPMLIGRDGSVRPLETGGLVVGLFGDVAYPDDSIQMEPGDIFLAYSDGVTEPENEFGEFGEERLIQLVLDNRHLPLARISDIVIAAVQDWIGGSEQPDDVTIVLARAR